MLQALKEEPPLSAKCKDKFLIQSTLITPEKESMSLHDIVCSSIVSYCTFMLTRLDTSGTPPMEEKNQKFTNRNSEWCICQPKVRRSRKKMRGRQT
jgi:hypothetical protein